MKFGILIGCLCWCLPVLLVRSADKAGEGGLAKLGSIDGASRVQVKNQGRSREVFSGGQLNSGDQVVTSSKVTATVLTPEGSVLIVGRDSNLEIQSSNDAQGTVEIHSGVVRGIISKLNKIKGQKPEKKLRFLIRTKAAVLGVRGTDFVVAADLAKGTAELHTLEGTVEVAQRESALLENGGVKVRGGQRVTATPEKMGEPEVFDPQRFSEEMKASQPSLNIPAQSEELPVQPATSPTPPVSEVSELSQESPLENTRVCKQDVLKFCRGSFGLNQIRKCLRAHEEELSPGCQDRIQRIPRRAPCERDLRKFCGAYMGQGWANCLLRHVPELSPECRSSFKTD